MLQVALFHPEIPANTGTIGRSCVLTGTRLHLIAPLGFSLDDAMIRRAGMGYWRDLDLAVHDSYAAFERAAAGARVWYCTKHGARSYADAAYEDGDILMFGAESSGIDADLLAAHESACVRIPMLHRESLSPATRLPGPASDPTDPDAVSLNLSNAANIVLFEALRQLGFPGMETGEAV